ncbi:hypothetical protein H5410_003770, partial [Solanum commersonii]
QQGGARQEVIDTLRIREFLRINPPSFTGLSITKDPESFVEKLKKVFELMHIADTERIKIDAYQLKNVARTWFDHKIEEEKLRDREEFRNKKAKTSGNKSRQQRNNMYRSSFQQKQKGIAPSTASAPAPKNKGDYNS